MGHQVKGPAPRSGRVLRREGRLEWAERWDGARRDRAGTLGRITQRAESLDGARLLHEALGEGELYASWSCLPRYRPFLSDAERDGAEGRSRPASISSARHRGDPSSLRTNGVTFRQPPHFVHPHRDRSQERTAFFEDHDGRPLTICAILSLSREAPDARSAPSSPATLTSADGIVRPDVRQPEARPPQEGGGRPVDQPLQSQAG